MDATFIVTVFVVFDDLSRARLAPAKYRPKMTPAELLPAAFHDLAPIHELSAELPASATLYGDRAYNCAPAEAVLAANSLRLVPIRRSNMQPHARADEYDCPFVKFVEFGAAPRYPFRRTGKCRYRIWSSLNVSG